MRLCGQGGAMINDTAREVLILPPEGVPFMLNPASLAGFHTATTLRCYAGLQPLLRDPDLALDHRLDLAPRPLNLALVQVEPGQAVRVRSSEADHEQA